MLKKLIFAGLFFIIGTTAFAEPDPVQLLTQMDLVLRGNTQDMTVSLEVKTKKWKRDYQMRVWMKGIDHSFVRVLKPSKNEGQGFLRIGARLWNYLPTAERTILIPPSMMLDRFMGSDFSNDDFVKLSYLPRDYETTLVGEETVDGFPVYHLDLKPKPDAPVTYGRLEIWVRKEDSAPVRWYFYNEKLEHIRTVTYSEFKDFGGHVFPTVWHMTNVKEPDRETWVRVEKAEFDIDLADSLFTREKLERYP